MPCRNPPAVIAIAALAGLLGAAPAFAAPPPNDTAAGAGVFSTYAAAGGPPRQQQAVAELAQAGPDPGVPRCLGPSSFARTVWYRLPEAPVRQEVTVDASGATLDVLDLAAFVQPPPPPPPAPAPAPAPAPVAQAAQSPLQTREPNVCSGVGAGGSDAAEEPTSAVTMLVPPGRAVLFQVGRRGPRGSVDTERALLSLETEVAEPLAGPRGDKAGTVTPRLHRGDNFVGLAGATITEEDPAQPSCPSLATVWRRVVPGSTGERLISVSSPQATTLAIFSGSRPTGANAMDCVNRERSGSLQMVAPVRRGRTLWVRIGTERTVGGEAATVRVSPGATATVVDGGKGGFDPTPYGPGGGFPSACVRADAEAAGVDGPGLTGRAGAFNRFTRVPIVVRTGGSAICDATLRLYGPRGHIYAKGRAVSLRRGRRVVRLPRLRTFTPGGYRLEVDGLDRLGRRVEVSTDLTGRLRKK